MKFIFLFATFTEIYCGSLSVEALAPERAKLSQLSITRFKLFARTDSQRVQFYDKNCSFFPSITTDGTVKKCRTNRIDSASLLNLIVYKFKRTLLRPWIDRDRWSNAKTTDRNLLQVTCLSPLHNAKQQAIRTEVVSILCFYWRIFSVFIGE